MSTQPDPINYTEAAIEQRLQAMQKTAPRLSPQDIDKTIKSADYTLLQDGRTTVCLLTLKNGFTVRGESSVISSANFDQAIGQDIAFRDARNKIWPLEAYLLTQRLWEQAQADVVHPEQG